MHSVWERLPLRWKVFLPYFLLMVLVAVGATYVTTRQASAAANERLTTELAGSVRAANFELLSEEAAWLDALGALARPELAEAAARRDAARLDQLIVGVPPNVEWVAVADPAGAPLIVKGRSQLAPGDPSQLAAAPPLRAALAGRPDPSGGRYAGVADVAGQGTFLAAAPLLEGERVVGALVVGSAASTVAEQMRRAAGAEIALHDPGGRLLASTLPGAPPLDVTSAPSELRPAAWHTPTREYRLLVAPLQVRGASVGALAVALPADSVLQIDPGTRTLLLLLFGLPIGLAVLVSYVMGGLITRPLLALVGAARRLGAGDLATRSRISGQDEIGLLGRTFDGMADSLMRREEQLAAAYVNTVRALAAAVDAKDPYTHGHSQRVATYAVMAGRQLGLDEHTLEQIEMGGLLHDVGKIGVPDAVLTKPDRPTDEEWQLLKRHPATGADILQPVGFGQIVVDVVRSHHERMNGRGYPDGLAGEDIPLVARIASVCDAYDTMTSDRAYRRSLGHENAVAELRRCAGDQFDPKCVEALVAALPDGPLPSGPAQSAYQPA